MTCLVGWQRITYTRETKRKTDQYIGHRPERMKNAYSNMILIDLNP